MGPDRLKKVGGVLLLSWPEDIKKALFRKGFFAYIKNVLRSDLSAPGRFVLGLGF